MRFPACVRQFVVLLAFAQASVCLAAEGKVDDLEATRAVWAGR